VSGVTDASHFGLRPERSVYDVALLLGIGAMTVCQDERNALEKLRAVFQQLRVRRVGQLDEVEPRLFRDALQAFRLDEEGIAKYPLSPAWCRVARILSVSGGCEAVREVVLTHQFLNGRRPASFRPPLFAHVGRITQRLGFVGRALEFEGTMRVQFRCDGRSQHRLHPHSEFTILVESEFGRDSDGDFEVPVIVAAFAAVPNLKRGRCDARRSAGGTRVD
jgi:hypothetical protein